MRPTRINGGSSVEQLRADIDTGRTGDKVPAPDPAAAPLGTDDEAGGSSPSPDAVAQSRRMETSRAHESDRAAVLATHGYWSPSSSCLAPHSSSGRSSSKSCLAGAGGERYVLDVVGSEDALCIGARGNAILVCYPLLRRAAWIRGAECGGHRVVAIGRRRLQCPLSRKDQRKC
jgi:hypothetical protein